MGLPSDLRMAVAGFLVVIVHAHVCVCVAKVSEWQHPHDGSMGIEMKVSKHNANTYRRACHAVRC